MGEKPEKFAPVTLKRGLALVAILAVLLAIMGWVIGEDWSRQNYESEALAQGFMAGMPADGDVIQQGLTVECEYVDGITLEVAAVGSQVAGAAQVEVLQGEQSLWSQRVDLAQAVQGDTLTLNFPEDTLRLSGNDITLRVTLEAREVNQLPAFWVGQEIDAGRFALDAGNLDRLTVNGEPLRGQLCVSVRGHSRSNVMAWYWPGCALLVLAAAGVALRCAWQKAHGKLGWLLTAVELMSRYRFLLEQLVARDFNTKYRQSLLGALWSFLNPLLTMSIQYVVFSTIFKNTIPNFPVYLMTGIVLFNYFSEATSLGLDSIVTSSALITKVYMPKYIYPLSRVTSSLVNLVISFVPLLLMMVVTGVPLTKSLLLTPLVVLYLFLFALGMAMILATMNVFFRDTRFLWGVVVLMWTYLTPIFYPETIIPAQLITLYHMNPMYQFIYFMRCITLGGVSPTPVTYLYCTLCSVVPLLVGLWVFKKNQDRFVFYL